MHSLPFLPLSSLQISKQTTHSTLDRINNLTSVHVNLEKGTDACQTSKHHMNGLKQYPPPQNLKQGTVSIHSRVEPHHANSPRVGRLQGNRRKRIELNSPASAKILSLSSSVLLTWLSLRGCASKVLTTPMVLGSMTWMRLPYPHHTMSCTCGGQVSIFTEFCFRLGGASEGQKTVFQYWTKYIEVNKHTMVRMEW